MTKRNIAKLILIISLIFFCNFSFSFAKTDGIDVNLHIGSCNNNNICEEGEEDFFVCPADCTPIVIAPNQARKSGSILAMDNVFNNLAITVTYDSATITWQSVIPVMSNLKWGTNPDYKDGVIRNIDYLLEHKIEISNLKEGSLYYFNIEAENLLGKKSTLENQIFRTLARPDTTAPGNPTKVVASSDPSGLTVSWQNPNDLDFDYVRVVRNSDRYYANPNQGYLVYEGKGSYFTDSKVVEKNKYYYSLFSRDRVGNYSSGSLIDIIYNPKSIDWWGQILTPYTEVALTDSPATITQGSSIFDFIMDKTYKLSGDEPINIAISYKPNNKNDDLWVEIKNDEKKIEAQYLFKKSDSKPNYLTATIPAFDKAGDYYISINRYHDKAIQIIKKGIFQISVSTESHGVNGVNIYIFWFVIVILFIILILLLLYFFILPRIFKRDR